jgi:hypothetical protein
MVGNVILQDIKTRVNIREKQELYSGHRAMKDLKKEEDGG